MGYSLGDDKNSFDVYENTNKVLEKVGNKLIEKGWCFDNQNYHFTKGNRTLKLETSQDHVSYLYISDKSINCRKLCDCVPYYDILYDYDDSEYGVFVWVTENTNIDKIVRDIEYAPLKETDLEL